MKKKILIGMAVAAGVLLIAVAVLLATFDLDETVQTQADQYLPELEKTLGRKVTMGQIKTTILPVLGAEVRDIVIGGRTPEEGPMVRIDRVRFGVELWTAMKSGGDEVRLRELVVDGLAVEIIREADGSLNYEDVLARLADGPPPEEEKPEPLSPEAKRFIRNLELDRIAIENSAIALVDRQANTTAKINDLLIELKDVRLDSAFEVRIAAAVLAEQRNFDLQVALGPIPVGDPDAKMPIDHIQLDADGVDLAALVPYMGADGTSLKSAKLSAALRIDDPLGTLGATKAAGSLTLAQLSVGHPKAGEPFDLVIEPNLSFSMSSGVLDLTGFSVALSEMKVTANGRVTGVLTGRPGFEGLALETDKFDFGRLFALLPDAKAALPPGMILDGPLKLDVKADGNPDAQTIRLMANLDGARVVVPDALDKPSGTALNTSIHADLTAKDLDLKGLVLALGPLSLKLAGTVKNFDDPVFDLKGGTTPTPIAGIARLFPQVKAAVPADVAIAGNIGVELNAKGSRRNLNAKVGVQVSDADLRAPGATLAGSGRLEVTARGSADGAVEATVASDLDGLAIEAGDAFKKAAGVPFTLSAKASAGADGALNLARSKVVLGPLQLAASGTRSAAGMLDAQVELRPLAVGELARILPGMADNPYASAQIELAGAVKGNPDQPETVEAQLSKFAFAQGRSSLSGTMTVKNPERPHIRFAFNAPYLDLDALLPAGDPEAAPEPDGPPPEIPEIVKVMDAAGSLKVARGRMTDIDFTNFDARLSLQNGRLTFESLDFDAYDGHFSGATTTVDLGKKSPPFMMKMALRDVSADAILTAQAGLPNTLKGRLSTEMNLTGNGLEWPSIRESLSGDLGMGLANGRFERLELGNAVLREVAAKIPALKLSRGVKTGLKDLAGQFEVKDGRMTLIKPMTARTAEGPILLTGSIGLDKTLDLKGTLNVEPATIARLSSNRIKLDKAIPVGLTIGGTLLEPEVSGIDSATLATALLGAAAMALGADKVAEAAAEAERRAREAADRARAEVGKRAGEARAEAERKKKELEAKARREADKAKKAAKKKAEAEAKKRLRGLF